MNDFCNLKSNRRWWPYALVVFAASLCAHVPIGLAHDKPVKPSGGDADAALAKKIGYYIDCINDHSNDVFKTRAMYFSWMKDPKHGPTGRERFVYGLYTLDDSKDCRAGIARAASLLPAEPKVEHSAAKWIAALDELEPVAAEAHSYYDLKDYKDDDMRKGKALHPQLMKAFARFEAANDDLYAQVVAVRDGLDQRRLQRLAADPTRHATYLLAVLSDEAKRISRLTDRVGSKNFDQQAYSTTVQAYEKAYFAVDTYRKQHPDDKRQAFGGLLVMGPAMDLLKSAKALGRRARDGFRYGAGDRMFIEAGNGELVEGHPKQVIDKYNTFISAMNTWGQR
ncbi:MAG: DUF3829 domain-containing protein [Rudaea sp.]